MADNINAKKLNVAAALDYLKKGLEAKVAWYEKEFTELKKAEADLINSKKKKLAKDGMDAPNLAMSEKKLKKDVFIDPKEANNPKERLKAIGPGLKTSLPEDEGMRNDGNDEGSGGQTKPNGVKGLRKRAMDCSMAKSGLNPDKLATRLQENADKAVRAKAEAPNAKESDVKQHQNRMHAKLGIKSAILGQKAKPEPKGKVAQLKARAHEASKPALPHVSYSPNSRGFLEGAVPAARVVKAALGMDPGGAPKKKSKLSVIGTTMPSINTGAGMGKKMPGISNPGGTVAGAGLKKEHIGFDKLKNEIAHEKGAHDAGAIAAAIGRKKYGSHKMAEAAHEGKPANKVKKNEELYKVAPPGREEQVKALKPKVGEASAFKIAWAAYDKAHGKNSMKKSGLPGEKQKLPDMAGFKSLVGEKPKPASPVAGINKELGGFKSLATKPKASPNKTLPLPGVAIKKADKEMKKAGGLGPTPTKGSNVDMGGGASPQAPIPPLGSATSAPSAPKTLLGGVGKV